MLNQTKFCSKKPEHVQKNVESDQIFYDKSLKYS